MDAPSGTRASHPPGRGRVFDSIVDAIGDTPVVALRRLPKANGAQATILAKLEYFNPANAFDAEGLTKLINRLLEATSGEVRVAGRARGRPSFGLRRVGMGLG